MTDVMLLVQVIIVAAGTWAIFWGTMWWLWTYGNRRPDDK